MATITGSAGNDTLTGNTDANLNDSISGLAGNDTLIGLTGNDTLNGGPGDDVITGGPTTGAPGPTPLDFNWSGVPDPGPAGIGGPIDNNDLLPTSTTQDTGGINVTATYANLGPGNEYTYATDGTFDDPSTISTTSSAFLGGTGATGNIASVTLDFAAVGGSGFNNAVENVAFNINDIDSSADGGADNQVDRILIQAFNNGVPVPVTFTETSTDTFVINGDGSLTITAAENSATATNAAAGWAGITIVGPVTQIVITYSNAGTGPANPVQEILISDVQFNAITPPIFDNDSVVGDVGNDTIFGGFGSDTIDGGADNDSIEGGAGSDSLVGGAGNDTLSYAGSTAGVNVNLGTGAVSGGDAAGDTIAGFENLTGSAQADTLVGDGNANILSGLAGADSLSGGLGNDVLIGGAGVDTIDGGDGNDTIIESDAAVGDSIIGGAGLDTADYSGIGVAINANLAVDTDTVDPTGGGNTDTLVGVENIIGSALNDTIVGDDLGNLFSGLGGADTLTGNAGNDTLLGGDAADSLSGGIDNDVLSGDAGVDTLLGGTGDDTLSGGAAGDSISGGLGTDTADYSNSTLGVNVNINDTVSESGGDAAGDTLTGIENITGSAQADTLTGNNFANEIIGGDGADSITGNLGSDSIDGGAGNDTINAGPDTIGGGAASPVNEFLDWTSTFGGSGSTIPNTATQDTGTMRVTVNFDPGNANQFQVSNVGIYSPEALFADNSSVRLQRPGAGPLTELSINFAADVGSGMTNEVSNVQFRIVDIDRIGFTDQATILAYDELGNLIPVSITTTSTELAINGNTVSAFGNGTTETGADGSVLITIAGPVARIVIQYNDLNDSTQSIHISDVHFTTIPATPDNTDADTVAGGLGDDFIEAGAGADFVSGDDGNDTLLGEAGTDTLSGGIGADSLSGGDGNDTLDGGADGDTLLGDAGNDSLSGAGGNDRLQGGTGTDTMSGGAGNDIFTILVGEVDAAGNDIITGGGNTAGLEPISTDNDTIDFSAFGWNRIEIDYTSLDPLNLVGTITIYTAAGKAGGVILGRIDFSEIETLICFTPGTMILTDRGEVAVEALVPGDRVMTRDHGLQELRWVGRRDLSALDLLAQPELQPVRIAKGAFGAAGPDRAMLVSPQHRVLIEGARAELLFGEGEVLVPAKHLVGQIEAARVLPETGVSYIHILFDAHEIVQSDGIWTESFQPAERTLSALDAEARAEVLALFPELAVDADGYDGARLSLKAHEARVLFAR